jgi:hypothetical protein
MTKNNNWILGKGGKGYKLQAAGKGRDYLTLTIPHEAGFKLGDRVVMRPMILKGVHGLLITAHKFEIKEKKTRPSGVKIYTSCRWISRADGKDFVCGKDLETDKQRERGLCERHIYCDDAKKAKAVLRSRK